MALEYNTILIFSVYKLLISLFIYYQVQWPHLIIDYNRNFIGKELKNEHSNS